MPPRKKPRTGEAEGGEEAEAVMAQGAEDEASSGDIEMTHAETQDSGAAASTATLGIPVPPPPASLGFGARPKTAGAAPKVVAVEPVPAEKDAELEVDAEDDRRPKLKESVGFNVPDTTLNVIQATSGDMLMTATEGGLQHFFAGARANVGIRSGRYMFEVRIVENQNQMEASGSQARSLPPRNLLRVGFSTAAGVPLMGDLEDSVCFDTDGFMHYGGVRSQASQRLGFDGVFAVVLNLEQDDGTVSLYKDGVRVGPHRVLPEALRGRVLFPTVTFKHMTVHLNFGPKPMCELPFRCRMLQEAAVKDIEVTSYEEPDDGKYNVIFPVCLPDLGTFSWCDWFLSKNPDYTELSDRKIIDWGTRSGMWRAKVPQQKDANDRPEINFGIASIDDGSAKRLLAIAASTQRRHLIVMEVRGNLTKADRIPALRPFRAPHFRRLAWCMAGQPVGEYLEHLFELTLREKQDKSDAEFQLAKAERDRKKALDARVKQVLKAKRKAERLKKKMAEEHAKKLAEEGGAAGQAERKDEASAAGGKDGEEDDDEEDVDEGMKESEDAVAEEPPKVELTEQEKGQCCRKRFSELPDIAPSVIGSAYSNWSFPDLDEGFDEIECKWQEREGCEYALRQWKNERKLASKVEYIAPSDWFKEKWAHWQKELQRWHVKHMEYKDPVKRAARKEALQMEKLANQRQQWAQGEGGSEGGDKHGSEKAAETKQKASKDGKSTGAKGSKKAVEEDGDPMEVLQAQLAQKDNFDIFAIEDVFDADGEGEPVFSNFAFEDWALLSLRFELHLVIHAFARDCKDPDRTGFPPEHLPFYYTKYFKRGLNPKSYGAEDVEELVELVGDTLIVCDRILESQIMDDLETNDVFVKLTEECRRDRLRRLQAGDESAGLKFSRQPPESAAAVAAAQMKAPPSTAPRTLLQPTQMQGGKGPGMEMMNMDMGAMGKGMEKGCMPGPMPTGPMPTGPMPTGPMPTGPMPTGSMPPMMDPSGMGGFGGEQGCGGGFGPCGGMDFGKGQVMGDPSMPAPDFNAGGDWSQNADGAGAAGGAGPGGGGGGEWDSSNDWDKGPMGMDFETFMSMMMEKGFFDKGKGKKGKGKGKAMMAMMMGKKGPPWGGDKGGGKGWKGGGKKGGGGNQAWKGGW